MGYAFVLGGGADLQLADLAEDAAKELITHKARNVFKMRCREKLKSVEKTQGNHEQSRSFLLSPSGWFLEAYLDSYEPLDIALGLDMNLIDIFEAKGSIQCEHCHKLFCWCYPEGLSEYDTDVFLHNKFLKDALMDIIDPNDIYYNFKAYYVLCILVDTLMAAYDPLLASFDISRSSELRDSVVVNIVNAESSNEMLKVVDSSIDRSIKVPSALESHYRPFNTQIFGVHRHSSDVEAAKLENLSILQSTKIGTYEVQINSDRYGVSSEQRNATFDKFHAKWSYTLSTLHDEDVRQILGVVFDEHGRIRGF